MRRPFIILLLLYLIIGKVQSQTVDQKLLLISNAGQIGGEFIVGYQVKGTNLPQAKTLASIGADVIYDSTILKFSGGTDWLSQFADSNGYVKRIKNNPETGKNQSVRIIITAPFLNDSTLPNSQGYNLGDQYTTLVVIHFIIVSTSSIATLSIKNITNQAGLFVNPNNQPNTFEVAQMNLSDPVIINEPLPVQITSFVSEVSGNNVKLDWKTVFESNNQGFEIQRNCLSGNSGWIKIGFVPGYGTSDKTINYLFEDKKNNSGKYRYRLKQYDYNGNSQYFNLGNIVEIEVPQKFNVSQNYPNPFNPTTKIDLQIPEDGNVKLIIYDLSGRELKKLADEKMYGGYYTLSVNGENLSSGVYFYRLTFEGLSNKFTITKKMSLIK